MSNDQLDEGFTWSDEYALGHDSMDHTHREFVACVDALLRAKDLELAKALDDFEQHARGHFTAEDLAMQESGYDSAVCHVDEHASVLKSLEEVRAVLADGHTQVVRAFARALVDWFPEHARVMDLGLARWLVQRRLGGSPVVVKRRVHLRDDSPRHHLIPYLPMEDPQLLRVTVTARRQLAEGIAGYELAPADGAELPGFEAGAHIDVHLPGGLIRQYSLHDLPGEHRTYRIGVLRDPQSRGGSIHMADMVQEGDQLVISRPRNHFGLHPGSDKSLLFAGGIGITPILCMAQQLAREGRPFELHYCGRSLGRMAFVNELRQVDYADRVSIHVDDGPVVHRLDSEAAIGVPAADRRIYVCGPTGFMDHILGTARALGWSEDRLHREYFAGAKIDHSADGPFALEIRSTGRVIHVAANQSAAQALLDAGIEVPLSCEQGVCGTCLTKVAAGVPDHRDLYMTEEERGRNDCFMPCCSRSCTPRLILDF